MRYPVSLGTSFPHSLPRAGVLYILKPQNLQHPFGVQGFVEGFFTGFRKSMGLKALTPAP